MKKGTIVDFRDGCRDAIPVCLGYIAVSFAFGIESSKIGMSVFQAIMTSLLNVTSAGQFSALEIIARNGSFIELAILQLIINLRYMLMSTALSQKLDPELGTGYRLGISYGVTDEIFALSVLKKGKLYPLYSYGLIFISVFGWVLGTGLGAFAGQIMPQRIISCLGLAIYGMFIAIIIPDTRTSKPVLMVVIAAMALSTIFTFAPYLKAISSGFRIIIITVFVAAIAAVYAPVKEEEHE
ncbi:Predicted branched-chain amino acid permease (azaleucine resistance) [Butyrivibrio hungatei DSM 14810]|uniref:Branched-chain amino acid transport protein AzlC n=2 Tax=Butyrivibrio hungatei TaxID=185008 RepID=A0A1D9P269_9FIRM|nr:AzlC family ABC transporter permease [Butyrivibrio hungatei]AOZ96707.1 branched-chain amino acid transport protein AzlC [Butyrivibrio hungatei]SHN55325.1 Predicted branched-chain amino acid permease (azaleucine resistance) [Butyrivibrio hungatei DSM 14810]